MEKTQLQRNPQDPTVVVSPIPLLNYTQEISLPTNSIVDSVLTKTPTKIFSATNTETPTLTETKIKFETGKEITIEYLRSFEINGSEITFEEDLGDKSNYRQHIVSYISEGNKIFGLLTIPFGEPPQEGFKAIVFNHGYIPPKSYKTTERYVAYVDYLARSGFVVFKIDYRGHGES
jgi:dipeptidyl aminopeptidase/acylaminoacyl peptidase